MYEYLKLQIVGQILTDYSYHVAGGLDEAEECIRQPWKTTGTGSATSATRSERSSRATST